MTNTRPLPDGWRWATLGEVCEVNPRRPRVLPAEPDELVTFIPMAAVDETTATVAQSQTRPLQEVTKGYTYMQEGDVIFAKITPCMQNGKHAIVQHTETGFAFGSTEFHVLRPGESVHPVWVHRFLLQPSLLKEAEQHFTGTAGQRRVPKDFLTAKRIPLPPIEEQRRIVAELEPRIAAAAAALRAAQAQFAGVSAIPPALLESVFPPTAAELPVGWKTERLGEICDLVRGVTFDKSEVSRSPKAGYVPVLRAGNIGLSLDTEHDLIWVPKSYVVPDQMMRVNDIAICMSSGSPRIVGKTAILTFPFDGSVGAFCALIRAHDTSMARFISFWFRSGLFAAWRLEQARGGSIQNLRMSELSSVEVPIPPADHQGRLIAALERQTAAVGRARSAAEQQLAAAEALPAAILRQTFRAAA